MSCDATKGLTADGMYAMYTLHGGGSIEDDHEILRGRIESKKAALRLLTLPRPGTAFSVGIVHCVHMRATCTYVRLSTRLRRRMPARSAARPLRAAPGAGQPPACNSRHSTSWRATAPRNAAQHVCVHARARAGACVRVCACVLWCVRAMVRAVLC